MSSIIFTFNGAQTTIHCNKEDKLKDICNKFSTKTSCDVNKVYYVYGGKVLDLNSKINEISNNESINILVFDKENIINDINAFVKSKEIICPKCSEDCLISFKDYKVNLFNCKNGHYTNNISLEEFPKTQFINESLIICNFCNTNKNNTYQKQFYKCLTCKKNLCPLCCSKHDKQHMIIDYNNKNYLCNNHNEIFISYCKNCKINLCLQCEKEHNDHSFISFLNIMPNEKEIKDKLNEFKKKIDAVNNNIKQMVEILFTVSKNLELYYQINNEIINNYVIKNRNYEIFQNINSIQNNIKYKDLDDIINENNLLNKFNKFLNIHYKIKNIPKSNEMTIIYKIQKNQGLKLFSSDFVDNNKENCYLYINGKKCELTDYLDKENINNIISTSNKEELAIKLTEIKPITNMNRMFRDCYDLISLPDFSEWDTSNITNLHSLFNGCSLLSNISDISKWNTSNVTDIGYMFWNCISLKNIPDISKWDVSKVKIMKGLFQNCSALKSLPDISKWDTSGVTDMSSVFRGCSSLTNLPNISIWNVSNVTDMNKLFKDCSSLNSLPDISNWKINKNKTNCTGMFDGLKKNIKHPF